MFAGDGVATMTGGTGSDSFVFKPGDSGVGVITDFFSANNALGDKVVLDIDLGIYSSNALTLINDGNIALNGSMLTWDADGSLGGGLAVDVVQINGMTTLQSYNLLLI